MKTFLAAMVSFWIASGLVGNDLANADEAGSAEPGQTAPHQTEATGDATFVRLLEQAWDFEMRSDPLWATHVGDHRFDDKLPDDSLAAMDRRNRQRKEFLARAKQFSADALSVPSEINRQIFVRLTEDGLADFEFKAHLIPITNRSGFHISFPELRKRVPLVTADDFRNYVARLTAFGKYTDDNIGLMQAGIAEGMVLPAVVLEGYREPIEAHLVDVSKSLFFDPFRQFPDTIAESAQTELRDAGRAAIEETVIPAYRRFLEFMETTYLPAARGSVGASALPNGRAYYRQQVKKFTTLDVTPDEVHAIGQREVQRIRKEMDQIIGRLDFEGGFQAFVEFLRTDPQFYAPTAEQLMKETAYVLKTMDGKLPQLFSKLPRQPYGIEPVPDYIAPNTTTAYYMRGTGDGKKAGTYFVNTFHLKSRPLYGITALSLHEAVPGHHLQLALQQELENVPDFRKNSGFTAFVEGWALYAERLGLEVDMYQDPYHDFGRLSYEIWRACRLVVDTGVHYQGWTRKQAMDFMKDNSAMSEHNVRAEVDRYISWPGQALAYKMGELKIRELRSLAESELGDRFDVRKFHDAVLAGGSVPLDVLEQQVQRHIEATRE